MTGALYDIDPPDLETMRVRLPNVGANGTGIEFQNFLSYEFAQDFLTPVAGGQFTVDQDELTADQQQSIIPGALVEVSISGNVQSIGYVDDIRPHGSRSTGSLITIEYREWLSPAVDCHVSPQLRFTASQTAQDLLQAVFEPLVAGTVQFQNSNFANRNAITGRTYGSLPALPPLTKKKLSHLVKPYDNEGAYNFAARVMERFGLHIWPAADGETIIVGNPDYTQEPRYQILHKTDPAFAPHNNVLEWDVRSSRKEQPTIIFASGFAGGAEFAKSTLKGGIINPIISNDAAFVQFITDQYPTVQFTLPQISLVESAVLHGTGIAATFPDVLARPLYLKDREAKTQNELNAFLQRELSMRVRKQLVANYTIEGHRINGQPVTVDTIIDVDDDRSNLHIPMWVLGRRFSKNATDGTKTHLELIRPGSLVFGAY